MFERWGIQGFPLSSLGPSLGFKVYTTCKKRSVFSLLVISHDPVSTVDVVAGFVFVETRQCLCCGSRTPESVLRLVSNE